MSKIKHSSIYRGSIRHRRFLPKKHQFRYPLFMLYLDLDELESLCKSKWYCSLEKFNIVSFRRDDYYSPESGDLKQAVINKVTNNLTEQGLSAPEIEHVRMLCHARYFNAVFNPVTFYYCFDKANKLVSILAEITNTPWGERHAYVLPVGQSGEYGSYALKAQKYHHYEFAKVFHVSPFNPMDMTYHWTFDEPNQGLRVHMDNTQRDEQNEKHFDATLVMERYDFTNYLASTLIRFPFMTVRVSMGIYWQALKLWLKRIPFYDHPNLSK